MSEPLDDDGWREIDYESSCHGRLRVTGSVPARAGLNHAETYTCVVVPGSSGPHVVEFDVKRAK